MTESPIRDAATIILVRDPEHRPHVLMGQRGAHAAFMPNKFVFPGGAVDPADGGVRLAVPLADVCATRLELASTNQRSDGLVAAAIRELWEEAGLILGAPGAWDRPVPQGWQDFAATGHLPSAAGMHFVFRAITPPGRTRRFDARFFLVDASHLAGDADDFSQASDELSHLQWVALEQVRGFDLPFITEIVLAEISGALPQIGPPESVPFFNNSGEQSQFERLGGQSPLASTT
ncbi:MAG: NUDIX hydrolase [Paracoccaceae bacterium]